MLSRLSALAKSAPLATSVRGMATSKEPVKVAITGGSGNIGYAMAFRIASGEMLGKDQPVIINLVELPGEPFDRLTGVKMELEDCAFPLLRGVNCMDNSDAGFEDISYAMLVGAKPRGPGMDRADLLKDNGKIFIGQGNSLNKFARKDVKTIVIGNPANTNCLIAATHAPDLDPNNFTAMLRLDHNRGLSQLAAKTGCKVDDIKNFIVWGNHSNTMYPDVTHATIGGVPAAKAINDDAWLKDTFVPQTATRGGAIIKARGASSAASAAGAGIDHIRDWVLGTNGEWATMGIPSDGDYNVPKGLYFGFPVTCAGGSYTRVKGLSIDAYSAEMIEKTTKDLLDERDAVASML